MRRYSVAYVPQDMEGRDFGELLRACDEIVFVYGPTKIDYNRLLPSLVEELSTDLTDFDPEYDVLVLSGSSTLCALSCALLFHRFARLTIAVYRNGSYDYYEIQASYTKDNPNNAHHMTLERVEVGYHV